VYFKSVDSPEDSEYLQGVLNKVCNWGETWKMNLNAKKSNVLTITRSSVSLATTYQIGNTIIPRVQNLKMLGIWIDSRLDWNMHVNYIANRADGTLRFTNRILKLFSEAWVQNLSGVPEQLRRRKFSET